MNRELTPRRALRLKHLLGAKAEIAAIQGAVLDERDRRVAMAVATKAAELGHTLGLPVARRIARAAILAYEAKP